VSTTESREQRPRLRYGPTLVLGLAGALAMTVGVAKPWVTATARQTGLPQIEVAVSGADLAPLAGALGVVVLAAFGAVIATRGWVRRALGMLIVLASLVVLVSALHPPGATGELEDALGAKGWTGGDYDSGIAAWRWLALAGSVASILAGLAISRYGGRWATMGAAYDAPGGSQDAVPGRQPDPAASTEADVWREIDEGRDPTDPSRRPGA
jgi:uncharacterized membrane protein (TIGR02234 family)